jgi:hypothetical protein
MFTGKILPKMAPPGLTFGQIYSGNQHNVYEEMRAKEEMRG